jgi:hypothetical protein
MSLFGLAAQTASGIDPVVRQEGVQFSRVFEELSCPVPGRGRPAVAGGGGLIGGEGPGPSSGPASLWIFEPCSRASVPLEGRVAGSATDPVNPARSVHKSAAATGRDAPAEASLSAVLLEAGARVGVLLARVGTFVVAVVEALAGVPAAARRAGHLFDLVGLAILQ